MTLVCSKCSRRIHIDESKLTARSFKVRCPQCGEYVVGVKNAPSTPVSRASADGPEGTRNEAAENVIPNTPYGTTKTILSSQLEERKALIWETDSGTQTRIMEALKRLSYATIPTTSVQDALGKLELESFAVVVVSGDKPETEQVLLRINNRNTAQRRQTFLVLLSSTLKTMKATSSFLHGANLVIGKSDLNQFEYLVAEGVREFASLYKIYNEVQSQ
jgi:predicted Zn finger-like uncharacterized protein